MHGLITFVPAERSIDIKGFLNWFVIAFGVFGVGMALSTAPAHFDFIFGAAFFGFVVLIYLIQARTYRRIAKVLRHIGRPNA